jgi:hypothetical protein
LIGFDASSQVYEITIIQGASGTHADTGMLCPTKGYWILMNEGGILVSSVFTPTPTPSPTPSLTPSPIPSPTTPFSSRTPTLSPTPTSNQLLLPHPAHALVTCTTMEISPFGKPKLVIIIVSHKEWVIFMIWIEITME